jgi:hypothetical protein
MLPGSSADPVLTWVIHKHQFAPIDTLFDNVEELTTKSPPFTKFTTTKVAPSPFALLLSDF